MSTASDKSLPLVSRKGCLRCKWRKKKCDEARPICAACRRNKLDCVWSNSTVLDQLVAKKAIAKAYLAARRQPEVCTYTRHVPSCHHLTAHPPKFLSDGYQGFHSDLEHRLLTNLTTFLQRLFVPAAVKASRDQSHVFSVGIQEIWVRNTLLAFAAFVTSTHREALRQVAYEYYGVAVRQIRQILASKDPLAKRSELLIATLFLGIFEVSSPDNKLIPLTHFEIVGRLLNCTPSQSNRNVSTSEAWFERKASESCLYYVSTLSIFYPRTGHFLSLGVIGQNISIDSSDLGKSAVISLDINIYRLLFDLSKISYAQSFGRLCTIELQSIKQDLDIIDERGQRQLSAELMDTKPSDGKSNVQFWRSTILGAIALRIVWLKVSDATLQASDSQVVALLRSALHHLEQSQDLRLWKGYLCWMLTIFCCAAYYPPDVQATTDKIGNMMNGMWGGDLQRMQRVLEVNWRRRSQHCSPASDQHHSAQTEASGDTLALLTDPRGILSAE